MVRNRRPVVANTTPSHKKAREKYKLPPYLLGDQYDNTPKLEN